jgi:hypothetical protein
VIDQLIAHPQQRERVGDRWWVYLLCDQCDRAGRIAGARRDPVETETGADVECACGHGADQHRIGPIVLWRLNPRDGFCAKSGCTCPALRPFQPR